MGHSNKSTTLNIYTHLFKDENDIGQSVANNFDDMFKNIKNSHGKVTEEIKRTLQPLKLQGAFGGGHGTRTHGAVTPYLISNQAP